MGKFGVWAASLATACAVIWGLPAGAQSQDYHVLFEERCTMCHGHAGAFAREALSVEDGRVVGQDGLDLTRFLSRHKGGLSPDETTGMLEMFRAQIEAGAFFDDTCKTCHDRAYEFARLFLIERDGVLWGRYSNRPVGEFLPGHARMTEQQAAQMTEALSAILAGGR